MKILRFVLVLAFMFTLSIGPVQAKPGERYGFRPLVTTINKNIPLSVQAKRAFEDMLPKLLAAQKNGAILEFQPELSAGILKIKYAAGARMDTLAFNKMQEFDDINDAVALVPHEQIVDAQPEIVVPLFNIELYSSCFTATGLTNSSRVLATMSDATNRRIANYAGNATVSGTLSGCFDWGSYVTVSPGYKLTYKVYDSAGTTLLGSYITTAPIMTFTSLNKETSVLSGTGPAGQPYSIRATHLNLNAGNTTTYYTSSGVISSNRTWSTDLGSAALRGGDDVLLEVTQSANFMVSRRMSAPYIYCQLGGNYCAIHTFPFKPASLQIIHAGVTYKFTGKADASGSFGVSLESATGQPIFLAKTDKVSGTGVPAFTLPNLTALPNYTPNFIYGIAPVNKYFEVSAHDDYNDQLYVEWAHSINTAAYYAVDFNPFDLKPQIPLTLKVYYIDPKSGNVTTSYSNFAP